MIVQKDFLNRLKDFGLNSYEAKLWTALLSRGVATAGELSDIANVPRSRSYDVLESLERKGFVIMKLGKPIKYIAVPPVEVLERVKKKIKEEAEKQSSVIEDLRKSEILGELGILYTKGVDTVDPVDLAGAIKGRGNLYNHLNSLIKNAEKSINIVTTDKGLLRKAESIKNNLKKARERGVKIRIAAPIMKGSDNAVKTLSNFAQIRNIKNIKSRFCVVDGKQTLMMVLDDEKVHPSYDFCIWVNGEFFAKSFDNIFNTIWDGMKAK